MLLMALTRYVQHPLEVIDYPCTWMVPTGLTITAVASTVSPAGPVVTATNSGLTSITRVATGGTTGVLYQVQEKTTFSDGQIRVSEFEIQMTDN